MNCFHKWCPDSNNPFRLQFRGCNVLFRKLRRNFFGFVSFTQVQSTAESKSAYFFLLCVRTVSKSSFSKFWQKSFGFSLGKSERPYLFVVVFSWMTESRTFERLSVFLECPIDFDDFLEQIRYSCNGRHVCLWYMKHKGNKNMISHLWTKRMPATTVCMYFCE